MKFFNTFSIIIAAKNESNNINSLFNSLLKLDYSQEKYEIIVVDDSSVDNTLLIAESYKNLLPLRVLKAENKNYLGKKGALDIGVKCAIYDIIITTDADCEVPPELLLRFNDYFNYNNDVVIGFAPFYQKEGISNFYSCFDNLRSSFLTFYLTKFGLPYNAYGRNFGYRKKVFNDLNGFEKISKSLSGDDDLLLNLAVSRGYIIGMMLTEDSLVLSNTKQTFREVFIQKTRHTKASHFYPLKVNAILSIWHISNIILFLFPLLNISNTKFYIPLLFKIVVDILIVKSFETKLKYRFRILRIIILQILYEIMLIIIFISSILLKDRWK